jgi:ketopantoate reductase
MYRGLLRNAPVEVDTIFGDLLDRGRKHGESTPILHAAVAHLSIYQQARNMDPSKVPGASMQPAMPQ